MFDILIRGGMVADGTGAAVYPADIAVQEGKIAAIGELKEVSAQKTIEARGKVVTPGFIDIHRHGDVAVFAPDFGKLELCQGLTTIVNGNCGLSAAPFGEKNGDAIGRYLAPITGPLGEKIPTRSLAEYYEALNHLPLHVGMLAGAGVIRADVAGYGKERLDASEEKSIQRKIERALSDGALGISLGLGYAPECFYTTEELIRTLAPLQNSPVPLTVHMRQEGGGVVESVEEMITVAKRLNCPVHISHLKAMGRENWKRKIPRALQSMQRAREEGVKVDCDVYPYTAGSTQLLHILPPEFLVGGIDAVTERLKSGQARRELEQRIKTGEGFDNIAALAGWDGIFLSELHLPEHRQYLGKSIAEIAQERGQSPLDTCCDLLVRERGQITMIDFMAAEEDIVTILQSPLSHVISDSTYPTQGRRHPRVYGTFARMIQHFVMEKRVLTLEDAVQKMTQKPARVLHLSGKGEIAVGMDGDLCVFDPANVQEKGTYTDPAQCAMGMDAVLVGGRIALENGEMTEERSGKAVKNHA